MYFHLEKNMYTIWGQGSLSITGPLSRDREGTERSKTPVSNHEYPCGWAQ